MSRPSKLTAEVQDVIVVAVRNGSTYDAAAQSAGIGESTFDDWMARGKKRGKANARHREFRAAVVEAEAEAQTVLVSRIARAAQNGSWSAAAWLLERRWPGDWAKLSERKHVAADEDETEEPADALDGADELAERRAARTA